jgi:hypothetical protein
MINDIPEEKKEINKHIVYGGLLISVTALYLYMTKDEDNSIFNGIEGLGIDVDPSRLIDSTVDKFAKHDVVNRGAKHLAKKLSYKLLG